jgi:hypothetical protein
MGMCCGWGVVEIGWSTYLSRNFFFLHVWKFSRSRFSKQSLDSYEVPDWLREGLVEYAG